MYKVLIGETEQSVIEDITSVVENELKDVKVVACAEAGREVVQLTMDYKPDLILIDIKIQGLNGLETIRKIREFNQLVHIIIISAYDYFEFAREALVLHVSDYILKPFNKTLLSRSIRSEMQQIKDEVIKTSQEKKDSSLYETAIQFAEHSFVYSILFNGNFDHELERYKTILGIKDYGYIMNIEIKPTLGELAYGEDKEKEHRLFLIKRVVSKYANCVIGPKISNRIIVYIDSKEEDQNSTGYIKDVKEKRQEAINIAYHLLDVMKEAFNINVNIGIGSVKSIKSIHVSYEEALKCLRYENSQSVVHIKEIRNKQIVQYDYITLENKLIENVKYGKQEALDDFTSLLEGVRPLRNEDRKNKIVEILLLSCHAARNNGSNESEFLNYSQYFEELSTIQCEKYEEWAHKKFQYILKSVRVGKNGRKSVIINAALEYIHQHYNEDISLMDVSRYVNVSPQHFSKIFKDETQLNFVEWVAKLRIDKAKEYMNTSDMTIKEICYIVGYQDPNYFSRIFKKYVGISPSEYVKGELEKS